jgi:mono/diheme cytochrome c family protein
MPSFGHLPEADLRALVERVKAFAEVPIEAGRDPAAPDRTGPIPIPAEPPDDAASRARGRELYLQGCAPCHGPTGRGDGQQLQLDEKEMPTWPRNFAAGEWKGGSAPEDFYRRVAAGIRGSPMPSSPFTPEENWHVVHWVRSEADLDAEGRNEQRRLTLRARRVPGEAPLDPEDRAWEGAAESRVALMPLWMRRTPRIQGMGVSALHDGSRLAIRLRWEDPDRDASTFGQREFRDAVAVQLSADPDPPFFGMGGGARPGEGGSVALWMWKADRAEDAVRRGDLESRFPGLAVDGWPRDGTKEGQVVPDLPLASHDPLFLGARAAGNAAADLSGACAAESLAARGAGTVGFRRSGAPVEARSAWREGAWTVVLRRTLADEGTEGVPLAAGGRASVAFALWNGADGERNGAKSVTVWHDLVLAEEER